MPSQRKSRNGMNLPTLTKQLASDWEKQPKCVAHGRPAPCYDCLTGIPGPEDETP